MSIKRTAAVLGALAIGAGTALTFGGGAADAGGPTPGLFVSYLNAPIPEGDDGDTSAMTFTLETLVVFAEPCEVFVQTFDISATGGEDYQAYGQNLVFPAGELTLDVDVTITGDNEFETTIDELVGLELLPGQALVHPACPLSAPTEAAGPIDDDDEPGDLFLAIDPDFQECEAAWHTAAGHDGSHATWDHGTVRSIVRLSRPLDSDEEVSFNLVTANGTATDTEPPLYRDYDARNIPITIDGDGQIWIDGVDQGAYAGETEVYIVIPIVDDFLVELDEFFEVNLENYSYSGPEYNLVTDSKQLIIIRNDDITGNYLTVSDDEVTEGDDLVFRISSNKPAICDGIKVHYYTSDGSATNPSDYTDTNGYAVIPPGSTYVDINVPTTEDLIIEGIENMFLTIDEPIGLADAPGADPVGEGTINDDDFPWVDVRGDAVVEGTGAGSTQLEFKFKLSGTAASPSFVPHMPIQVCYQSNNVTAVTPSDYVDNDGCVNIDPSDDREYVYVTVVRDSNPENNETMEVEITSATNANIDYGDNEDFPDGRDEDALGTIYNDDDWVVTGVDVSYFEGTPPDGIHNEIVTLLLNAPAPSDVGLTVDWDLDDGTAAAAQPDYVDDDGNTVAFAPSATSAQVLVGIVPDEIFEADETVIVNLYNPTNVDPGGCWGGCFRLIIQKDAVVTILNDDPEDLPETGSGSTSTLTIVGLGLAGAGLALVFGTRRRRASLS